MRENGITNADLVLLAKFSPPAAPKACGAAGALPRASQKKVFEGGRAGREGPFFSIFGHFDRIFRACGALKRLLTAAGAQLQTHPGRSCTSALGPVATPS